MASSRNAPGVMIDLPAKAMLTNTNEEPVDRWIFVLADNTEGLQRKVAQSTAFLYIQSHGQRRRLILLGKDLIWCKGTPKI